MPENKSVGAMWVRKEDGKTKLISIQMEDGKKYVAFPNSYKKEDKHPDFKIYVSREQAQTLSEDLPQAEVDKINASL